MFENAILHLDPNAYYLSVEQTFRFATNNTVQIKATLQTMAAELSEKLRKTKKHSAKVIMEIVYSDGKVDSARKDILATNTEKVLIGEVKNLFDSSFARQKKVQAVTVKVSGLVSSVNTETQQQRTEKQIQFMREVDQIRNRFGVDKIMRATCMRELLENATALAS